MARALEIGADEVVALVGENGSGKTTLAKVLFGLYRPDSGRVRWDGVDVAAMDPDRFHDRVAVLFQDFARFMLTAKEDMVSAASSGSRTSRRCKKTVALWARRLGLS